MNIRIAEIKMLPDGRMDRQNAAAYCGLSAKTLAMYASKGTGPKFVKRGLVWYFRDELDAWLAGGKASSSAAARLNNG